MRTPYPKVVLALVLWVFARVAAAQAPDPLPSWNDGPARAAIVEFVTRVTTRGSSGFVPPAERIATFDNDGTLWSEQPLYFQGFFALDRIRDMAPEHPEWRTTEPFKSAIAGDVKGLMATGMEGVMKVLLAAHSNVTTIARDAADTTPRFGLIVHHTDAEREFAYDRESHMGKLDQALDEAKQRGWLVVDMQADWRRVYPTTD